VLVLLVLSGRTADQLRPVLAARVPSGRASADREVADQAQRLMVRARSRCPVRWAMWTWWGRAGLVLAARDLLAWRRVGVACIGCCTRDFAAAIRGLVWERVAGTVRRTNPAQSDPLGLRRQLPPPVVATRLR